MIRSNVGERAPEAARANSAPARRLIAFLVAMLATSALVAVLKPASLTPLEVLLWRPLVLLVAAFAGSAVCAPLDRRPVSEVWYEALADAPLACAVAAVAAVLGIWHTVPIATPLDAGGILTYLFSAGSAAVAAGPDAYLRGFVWALTAAAAVRAYRTRHDPLGAFIRALAFWLAATAVAIFPSVVVLFTNAAQGASVAGTLGAFTRLTMDSYWGGMQITRWFTGFGDQAATTYALFTGSVIWLAGCVVWAISSGRAWIRAAWSRIVWLDVACAAFALALGLTAGWSRAPWAGLDFAAWLVASGVAIMAFLQWLAWRESDTRGDGMVWFWLVSGSALLGWPVLLAMTILVAAMALDRDKTVLVLPPRLAWLARTSVWFALSALAFAFVLRGGVGTPAMVRTLLAFTLLLLPAAYAAYAQPRPWLWVAGAWLMAAAVSSLLLMTFAPFALVLLGAAVFHVVLRLKPGLSRILPPAIWLVACILMMALVWLPRIYNPRLMPY